MQARERVVIPIDSQDPDAWLHAQAYAAAIGTKARPAVRSYVLLTHTQHQLKGTSLAGHLGDAKAKALLASRGVAMPTGGELRYATLRTLGLTGTGTVVICFYADDAMLQTLDGISGIVGVVAVPEFAGDVDKWIARWNPVVHGLGRESEPAALIADAVVEAALEYLTKRINLSHALMNPRDKGTADETLRILVAKGHTLEPDGITSWAIRRGWVPSAADELGRLAGKIDALKRRPSLSSFTNPDGKYESWGG